MVFTLILPAMAPEVKFTCVWRRVNLWELTWAALCWGSGVGSFSLKKHYMVNPELWKKWVATRLSEPPESAAQQECRSRSLGCGSQRWLCHRLMMWFWSNQLIFEVRFLSPQSTSCWCFCYLLPNLLKQAGHTAGLNLPQNIEWSSCPSLFPALPFPL